MMKAFEIGNTAVIFANSLFTGFSKVSHQIFKKSDALIHWGELAMVLLGGYYVISGIFWFF
jgi:cytochrome c-type biogenesis protein